MLEVSRLKEDGKGDYKEAVRILVFLRALIKRSRAYLTEKLEQGQVEDDASVLYEELGGIWNLDRLIELGLKKENVRLLQLSFHVSYDGARRELVDKGWWLDLDSGEIDITYNYRPVKALKYVKEEDSVTEALQGAHAGVLSGRERTEDTLGGTGIPAGDRRTAGRSP